MRLSAAKVTPAAAGSTAAATAATGAVPTEAHGDGATLAV